MGLLDFLFGKREDAVPAELEAMSIDELAELKHRLKDEGAPRAQLEQAHAVQTAKIAQWHKDEAAGQIARAALEAGRTSEQQARYWLRQGDLGQQVQARLYLGLPRIGRDA